MSLSSALPSPESRQGVHCAQIVKEFPSGSSRTVVLKNVTADFPVGQLSLLVGPSGCGKTTLISILAGLLTPTSGTVSVFGTELGRLSGSALTRLRLEMLGFVFQQYHLMPALSAAENTAVPLVALGVRRGEAIRRANDLLDRLGMAEHTSKLPSQLSGGQQQRVAIARALINNPRLLICDEPTAALDAASGHRVMAVLRDVAVAPDRTCIVVTHDHRVHAFADRIVEMEDGAISGVRSTAIHND